MADRAARRGAALARRARDPLPRARDRAARRTATSGPLDLGQWVSRACATGRATGDDESEVPWSDFQRRHPRARRAPACASSRSAGPAAPARRAARRGLPPPARPRRLGRAARGLGAALPRRPGRAGGGGAPRGGRRRAARPRLPAHADRDPPRASDVDRLLTGSAAKPLALVEVLGAEAEARGTDLRALVLCDAELSGARPDGELRGVLDPDAGTARAAVRALADDARTAVLRPLLVSGRGLRCAEEDAAAVLAALRGRRRGRRGRTAGAGAWRAPAGRPARAGGLVELRGPGDWRPRRWVALATARSRPGGTRRARRHARVPRRGLERAVRELPRRPHQRRDRRLRAADARPLAAARSRRPGEGRVQLGRRLRRAAATRRATPTTDRFVRKHRHLHAPADDGTLEAGRRPRPSRPLPVRAAARRPLPGDRAGDGAPRRRPRRRPRALADRRAVRGPRGRDARAAPRRRGTPPPPAAPPPSRLRGSPWASGRCSARALLAALAAVAGAVARRAARCSPALAPGRRRSPASARRPRTRATPALLPAAGAAGPHRARGLRRLRRARRAAARCRRLARVRAARVRLPALPAAGRRRRRSPPA